MREGFFDRARRRRSTSYKQLAEGIGRRVAYLRQRAGMTQAKLADAAGLHVTGLSMIERGQANPSLLTLSEIADALDVPLSRLVSPKDAPRGANPRGPGRPKKKVRKRR